MMQYLIHHLLEESADNYPDHLAVRDHEREFSYIQLEEAANQLANLLSSLGVGRGDRVGLHLNKSLESVIGIYGILKCGAAYVPLDPDAPEARIAYMCANCGIRTLLTGLEKSGSWKPLLENGAPLENIVVMNGEASPRRDDLPAGVDTYGLSERELQPSTRPNTEVIDLDLAYVLYTSGSTGLPKGVMLSHLNALTFVNWTVEEFSVEPADRLSSHAPFHFDLSIFDLFAAASAGASVVLVPPEASYFPVEISRFIEREGITIWYSVPSILSLLVLRGNLQQRGLASLRTVVFAGEVFPVKYLRSLMAALPRADFYNLYGPTETNVCTSFKVPQLDETETKPIPIGKAIDNVEVVLVTDEGTAAAVGEVGELYVRGTTVMQGYWGDAERTRNALIQDPLGRGQPDLWYRTGDLVRQQPDGNYELLGRRDHQIKSRGYRIELGEIESALYAHPAVAECAVVAIPDEVLTNRIKACIVLRKQVDEADLVKFCENRLPHYMLPEAFEIRESLPKTSTGKVDRQSLAVPN